MLLTTAPPDQERAAFIGGSARQGSNPKTHGVAVGVAISKPAGARVSWWGCAAGDCALPACAASITLPAANVPRTSNANHCRDLCRMDRPLPSLSSPRKYGSQAAARPIGTPPTTLCHLLFDHRRAPSPWASFFA